MGQQRLDKLCQAVLPPGYEQVKRQAPAIQKFLEENMPEPVNNCVTLLTLNADEIVIAANNPAVASYLRMHQREIGQQLRETFQFEQRLRFCTLPDSMLRIDEKPGRQPPREASTASVEAIRSNAKLIEDEELRAAMLALADSLETR